MAQYRTQTLAYTMLRSLVMAMLALVWFTSAYPVLAQNEVSSVESILEPPPPTAAITPTATSQIDATDRETAEELGYQILLQGPVHEAFAFHADSGSIDNPRVYSEQPPANVREQAPEVLADGDHMLWIPGYWSWDDQVEKYVWVSGVYRRVPPGRTWVAGFWSQQGTGYRWTSGYWAETIRGIDEQVYLPNVPQSIENGPSVPPPGEDYFWLPGAWEYDSVDFRWRSGYWTRHYDDWAWQPACYISTQNGFFYNTGYWDRLPPDRGTLYAPIDFYRPAYLNPGYIYRPQVPLSNSAALLLNLFARQGQPGFYYGDFYGPSYAAQGYRPWFDMGYGNHNIGLRSGLPVPWLAYYDWKFGRRGIDFVGSMGRYQSAFGQGGRGSPKSMKFPGGPNNFSVPAQGSRGVKAKSSFDDYVLHDFNGQMPPQVNRKSQNASFRYDGSSSAPQSKHDWDSKRSANRDSKPANPKQYIPGVMSDSRDEKPRGTSEASKSFNRGSAPPSVERGSPAPRSSDFFGGQNKGNGQSLGGGNGGGKGGGNGNGGGNGGRGGGNSNKGGGKK